MEDYTEEFEDDLEDEIGDLYDDDGEEDEFDEEVAEPSERRNFRLSRTCFLPPRVRMLVERHRREITAFLNEFEDSAQEFEVCSYVDRKTSVLGDPEDLRLVVDALKDSEETVLGAMSSLTDGSDWGDVRKIDGWRTDLKMLRMLRWLSKLVAPATWHVWVRAHAEDREFHQRPEVRRFWAIRSRLERSTPEGREAYRERDTRRRKSRKRKEYLMEYSANPGQRAKRAAAAKARRAALKVQDLKEAAE